MARSAGRLPAWIGSVLVGDLVNLNRARKARARTRDAATAEANRARHGRTRAERERDEAERARRDALLDGARLED